MGNGFIKAYEPIIIKRFSEEYSEKQKDFQLFRRGRYAEFNLVFDRGTLFGLQSNGRTESILMSMPPLVKWEYNYKIEENSLEQELYNKFLIQKNWV